MNKRFTLPPVGMLKCSHCGEEVKADAWNHVQQNHKTCDTCGRNTLKTQSWVGWIKGAKYE